MQILEELWYGQVCPVSTANYQEKEYRELESLLKHNENILLPTLNQKQQEDLQKMKDLWEEMDQVRECSAFVTGFRLAIQLMAASV